MKNNRALQDLIQGWHPKPEPTLRELATQQSPPPEASIEEPQFYGRLPGDEVETHPGYSSAMNPFPGEGPLAIVRKLRTENLSPELRRRAEEYLRNYSRFIGQSITGGR